MLKSKHRGLNDELPSEIVSEWSEINWMQEHFNWVRGQCGFRDNSLNLPLAFYQPFNIPFQSPVSIADGYCSLLQRTLSVQRVPISALFLTAVQKIGMHG